MNKVRLCIYIFIFGFFSLPFWGAQFTRMENLKYLALLQDTINNNDTLLLDSLSIATDSIPNDSVENKDPLEAPVDYNAKDSIIFDLTTNHGYFYGESQVDYTTMSIKAEYLTMSMDSSIIHGIYGIDSVGNKFGTPVFKQGDTEYEMNTVSYNFKSKKGFIRNVITQQGEGYIVADLAKKNADDSFFMCNGKYTTCDQHDHPHFYMMLTKAKVRPKKNVVTGPAYFVLEGLPLPLAIPFGFFPFTESYSSGVIMPSYGDDMDRGFSLRNGGYYFAINDYVDLALTGEIYTKGSWAIQARSTYRKRYRFNGSFDLAYMFTKYGDKEVPETYTEAKDLRLNWTHTQDPKANMYRTLSANVQYSTSTFNRYNQEGLYNPNLSTSNTKSSSVTLTQRFPNSPFSINANVTANQRTQDSTISLTLPNLTVTMSRIYPFKRKNPIGAERWYEKVQMSYTGDFRNSITTKDNLLFKSNLIKDWKNGAQHRIPVSATFSILDYINITPSVNYTENWYTRSVEKRWDAQQMQHVSLPEDTTYGFHRTYFFNYAVGIQTKLYGFYEPIFKIGKLKTIRHVFTPSISFSGNPDFTNPRYGTVKKYHYLDNNGRVQEHTYSPYEGQVFAPTMSKQSAAISFSFENNVEMKVGTDNDSTKIISLIDNLGINFSYNAMAPSTEKWSMINTNLRLKLSKSLMVNVGATWDPYAYEWDPINRTPVRKGLRMENGKGIAKLATTGYSISPSINQDTFKKWFGKGDKKDTVDPQEENEMLMEEGFDEFNDPLQNNMPANVDETPGEYDRDGYLKNEVKWNLGFNYSMAYAWERGNITKERFEAHGEEFPGRITHTFGMNGSIQPTKNWNFTFTTSYNFENDRFEYLNCTLSRNLHCWNISASFIPIGPYTSYYVSIRVNSSMLQDLKYEQRSRPSSFDPRWD